MTWRSTDANANYQSAPFPADGEFVHHVAVVGPEKTFRLKSANSGLVRTVVGMQCTIRDESHPIIQKNYAKFLTPTGL